MSEYRLLPLSGKRGKGLSAKVSIEDFERLSQFKWHLSSHGYATRKHPTRPGIATMHEYVLPCPEGMVRDHINGDGLDNRRKNLRVCTHAENIRNRHSIAGSSPYIGVCYITRTKRWNAKIMLNRKSYDLGSYDTEIEAALVRDVAAPHFHGEYAALNFPDAPPIGFLKPSLSEVLDRENPRSPYKFVRFHKRQQKWIVVISGKQLGSFESEIEAAHLVAEHLGSSELITR